MKKYVKFVVTAHRGPGDQLQVPWTGIDGAMEHVGKLLADGYTVEVVPFTQEEWASGDKPRTL